MAILLVLVALCEFEPSQHDRTVPIGTQRRYRGLALGAWRRLECVLRRR
jgi:hypothetical protein